MNNAIIAIAGLLLLVVAGVRTIASFIHEDAARPRWVIVCNSKGEYSFLDKNGELYWLEYPTREEAEAEMEKEKNAPPFDVKEFDARKAAREDSFKPCTDNRAAVGK